MPPVIYLVRHAHAHAAENDAARQLSGRGRAEVRQVAEFLKRSGAFRPAEVWHSPLVRARETAELLVQQLGLGVAWHEHRNLEPEAEPARVAAALVDLTQPVALFGHEPHLGALASLLVAGAPAPVVFTFQKATILALEPVGLRWSVRWQLAPDLFAP
jgi:phosphohistidine phosphatase